jgi:hypothetical protein
MAIARISEKNNNAQIDDRVSREMAGRSRIERPIHQRRTVSNDCRMGKDEETAQGRDLRTMRPGGSTDTEVLRFQFSY